MGTLDARKRHDRRSIPQIERHARMFHICSMPHSNPSPTLPDLFNTPVIAGLTSYAAFLDPSEERALIRAIDDARLTPFRFQQWTGKRLTRSYGPSYDFQTGRLDPADPVPDWLRPFADRAADICGLPRASIEQALLIRYDPGAGIGWHKDRPAYEHVIGLSLGAPATMRLRRRDGAGWQRRTLELVPRGLYRLSGEARHMWEHSIAGVGERRYAVTLRSLAGDMIPTRSTETRP
ncbi:alpha-ketoglutarate-dependent dioxygenase AlkB [Sphingomonas sanxanigenens]